MKITEKQLKQIINEEIMKIVKLGIGKPDMDHGGHHKHDTGCGCESSYEKDIDGYEGSMAISNLRNAAEDAIMLAQAFHDDENIEPWVQEKIAVASSMINSVARYVKGGRAR